MRKSAKCIDGWEGLKDQSIDGTGARPENKALQVGGSSGSTGEDINVNWMGRRTHLESLRIDLLSFGDCGNSRT